MISKETKLIALEPATHIQKKKEEFCLEQLRIKQVWILNQLSKIIFKEISIFDSRILRCCLHLG